MQTVILIDGNAIMHRAFHALPPLTSKHGQMVNAVYGFFSMLLKILQEFKPMYLAVCFDRPKPTFRQELYVGYQAHRPKMSDDLIPQIQTIHELLEKAQIPIFEIDGYEADDLIGTLAFQLVQNSKFSPRGEAGKIQSSEEKNIKIIIVSGDRDMLQLVNSHVKVAMPVTGITNMVLFDSRKVEEKYGIRPDQIIDYKALVGDASDNYPGVSGIGPKTASELLKTYGSFENLYEQINQLPEKIGVKLATDAEQAAMAKKLATIVTDAPVTLDIKVCACTDEQMDSLKKSFEELGFTSLVKRIQPSYAQATDGKEEKTVTNKTKETEEEKTDKSGQMGLL